MADRNSGDRENLLLVTRMTNNNETLDVAEVLNEVNEVIEDAIVQQSTDMTSHVFSRRTSLPAVNWVKLGNGWNATVGLINQVREEIGQLKARFLAPEDIMDIQPNPSKYRMQQERGYIESMGQELSNTLFGNFSSGALSPASPPPEEFAGFQYRYNSLGSTDTNFVINNGNTTGSDNTSVWFVQWGAGKVYLISPRNAPGGLSKVDKGLQMVSGDNAVASTAAAGSAPNPTNQLHAFVTEFAWRVGLAVEDLRTVKRLANIDSVAGSTFTLNVDNIIKIQNNFKSRDMVSMYTNETVFTQLDILAKDKTNVFWSENNPFGRPQLFFRNSPIRRTDAISNDEGILTT